MLEFILAIPYAIIGAPIAVIVLKFFITLMFSPVIVANDLLNAATEEVLDISRTRESLVDQLFLGATGKLPTDKEREMFSGLDKKEIYEMFKTMEADPQASYDPKYAIDDPFQFDD